MTRRAAVGIPAILLIGCALCILLLDREGHAPSTPHEGRHDSSTTESVSSPGLEGRGGEAIAPTPAPEFQQDGTTAEPDRPIGALTLTVVDPEGLAVPRAEVWVGWDAEGPPEVVSNDLRAPQWRPQRPPAEKAATFHLTDGRVEIPRYDALRHLRVEITPIGLPKYDGDPHARARTDLLVRTATHTDAGARGETELRISLERGLLIEGRVLQADGMPADMAACALNPSGVQPWRTHVREEQSRSRQMASSVDGRFVFGRVPAGAYGLVSSWLDQSARVFVEGRGHREVEVRLGTIEGPYIEVVAEDGALLRLERFLFLPAEMEPGKTHRVHAFRPVGVDWASPETERRKVLHLLVAPSMIGERGFLSATSDGRVDPSLDYRWGLTIEAGKNTVRTPATAEARLDLTTLKGGRSAYPRDVGGALENDTPTADRPDVWFSAQVSPEGRTLRLPRGVYDLMLRSVSPDAATAHYPKALSVPGSASLVVYPRRNLRVRVVGARDLAQLTFDIDGSGSPEKRWTLEGDIVTFHGVDPGPRHVSARWKGSRPALQVPEPSPLGGRGVREGGGEGRSDPDVMRQIGEALIDGDEGVLEIRRGHALVFTLPKTESSIEPTGLRANLVEQASGRPVFNGPLMEGASWGYGEDTFVTHALPFGAYSGVVTVVARVTTSNGVSMSTNLYTVQVRDVRPGIPATILQLEEDPLR